jgi:PAS domain S-box-containing protein
MDRRVSQDNALGESGEDSGYPGAGRAVLILDAGGRILSCRCAERLFGCGDARLLATPLQEWIPGLRLAAVAPDDNLGLAETAFAGDGWQRHRVAAADGRSVEVDVSVRPMTLGYGQGLLAIVRHGPQAAPGSRGVPCFIRLAEQSRDTILLADRRGFIEYANPAFEQRTGFSRDEALGKRFGILIAGANPSRFFQRLWASLRSGQEFRGFFIERRKNGDSYCEARTIRPFVRDDGRITHFVSIGRAIGQPRPA